MRNITKFKIFVMRLSMEKKIPNSRICALLSDNELTKRERWGTLEGSRKVENI